MKMRRWSKSGIVFLLSISLLLCSSFKAQAGEAKYIYDDLGRLYQVVDQQGNVATYNYDAVGNLLSIIRSTGGRPAPEITGVSPNLANPGDTVQVIISGNHFLNTGVSTNNPGINISNLQIAETSITATFSISFFSPIGLTTVTVSNALGSANIGFTVNPQPIINALSPSYGPVSRLVTISGTGFSAVPSENLVLFSGVSAPIYSCTPFSILTSVPTGATSGAVTVTTKGIVSNWKGFTVISAGPPPIIDSIIPNVGSEEGGDTVTISGSGFTSDTSVYISKKPVASITVIDASTLRIVTAPGAVGSWEVLVTNQNGDAVLPGGFTFISGPPQRIVSVNPAMGQTNIPTNTLITVLFARPVDRVTVSSSTFSLVETGTAIQVSGLFSFGFDDRILIFQPTVALKPNTSYTLNTTTGIKSSDGIQLDQPFSSSFTTAGFSDNASPIVTMSPNSGATGVPINTLIVLIFSEPINPTSINYSTFVVTNNGMPVSGNTAFSNQNTVLAFAPFSNLLPSSFVNVALSPGVTDVAGNPIVGSGGVGTYFVGSFTTADTFDTVAPSIAVDPPNNATGIDTNASVSVTFSEPINPSTLSPGTFTVSVEGSPCPGRISLSGLNSKATFIPDQPFPYLSLVTVNVAAGISDVAGNAMTTSFTSTFTTEQESILTLAYSGPTTLAIGETISVDVANTGDKDTSLTHEVSLSGRGTVIYQTSLTDAIAAGATKSYGFQIPAHVASGDYTLNAEVTNNKGKKTTEVFFINILGLNATLTTRTDKDFYLATEPITAVSTIQNGSFGIEGGSLRVAVSRVGSLPTDAFFEDPIGVAAAPDGSFYVADAGNFSIARFNSTGKFFKLWGSYGGGNGQFETIICIAVGPDGSVYVGDTSNWILRVQKFDGNGRFITKWNWDGGGYLDHPFGIAVGPDGSVYVADQGNNRIRKLGDDGNFVSAWGNYGSGDGQFFLPTGIAVGSDGFVYVADTNNNRIQKFDSDGNFIAKWGNYGEGDGQFNSPFSIAVGPDGSIYVVDGEWYYGEHRLQKFDSNGNFIAKWLDYGSGDGSSNIAVALSGSVYVTDTYYNQINVFDNNGNFVYNIQELVPEMLFETTTPINQPGNTTQDHTANIETLSVAGPLYLQTTLFNSLGQIIGQASYPFFRGEPLSVVSVIPNMGLTNVSVNTAITVQFSKPVDLTTVNSISLSLTEIVSGIPVSGTLSSEFGDRLVIFRPNSNLIPNTTYSLSITTAIKSADGIPLDQAFSGSFTTAGLADTVPPGVTVVPQNGSTGVPVNARVVFGFSEPMNPLTINSSAVTITNNGVSVSGNITLNEQNSVATFSPGSSFLPNSVVNVTLSHKVTDLAGNPIVGSSGPGTDFMSSFSTANAADSLPPQVLSINPPNGGTGIDINATISVTFSEPVNPITVNNASFVVSVAGTPYTGLISFSGQNTVVTFTPDQTLPTSSVVTVTLSAGISDVAGNGMASPFASTFTTYQKGPILTIGYSGATTLTVGETINVEVANTGDADTTSTYSVKMSDSNGLGIYQNTILDTIGAGASRNYDFQLPGQAVDGDYTLYAEVTDNKGKKTTASFSLKIIGLTAIINTRTDKETYGGSESITGISSIINGSFGIEGGSLRVSVNGIGLTTTGGFKNFLPKNWIAHGFSLPIGIAIGSDGSVYVVNSGNHEIQKFDGNGNFITKWGTYGDEDGQFIWPSYVAAGSDGSVYVTDSGNNRIQKFDGNGNFITKWGSEGNGDGQFTWPYGIAVGVDGSVYVGDANDRIQKFNSDGTFITKWGSQGWAEGQFYGPSGIAVDSANYVYVGDGVQRIQKLN
jgi:YD repeat-containing protein